MLHITETQYLDFRIISFFNFYFWNSLNKSNKLSFQNMAQFFLFMTVYVDTSMHKPSLRWFLWLTKRNMMNRTWLLGCFPFVPPVCWVPRSYGAPSNVNHYAKIMWNVRLGVQVICHPLSWGWGGAQTEKIQLIDSVFDYFLAS